MATAHKPCALMKTHGDHVEVGQNHTNFHTPHSSNKDIYYSLDKTKLQMQQMFSP